MRKKGNTVLAGLIICLLLVFLAAAGKLFGAYLKYQKGDVSYEKLQEYVQEPEEEESPESEKEKEEPKNRYLEIDFAGLKAVNPDVIAWIQIPALDISYPVVQGKDNAYYLHHLFSGESNINGSIFVDCHNQPDFTDQNTIVYGHNMKNGSMFGTLDKYQDKELFEQHPEFYLYLPDKILKPARGEKYLKYQGKYYTLSEKRIPYQRDKTQDSRNRFWILTLFAIAMELEQKSQIQPEDVIQVELPIGLPPKHFAELCERYERYFKGDGKVQELCFNDKVYHLCIQNVMAFPQDYAAMMTRMMEIREIPKVVGIDIGGFTSDYLLMRSGRPDMDYCDSLEKGVITMYNDIISSINSEYDMLLEEADIDSIIKGKTQYYEEAVVQAVETMVQNFVTDLLNSIRERGIDTKSTYTVFIGGGAVLLERFLEQADRLGKHTFIRDMKANADGYDLLYRMTQAGV